MTRVPDHGAPVKVGPTCSPSPRSRVLFFRARLEASCALYLLVGSDNPIHGTPSERTAPDEHVPPKGGRDKRLSPVQTRPKNLPNSPSLGTF